MRNKIGVFKIFSLIAVVFVSRPAFAGEKEDLQNIYDLYQKGAYSKAIDSIDAFLPRQKGKKEGVLHYWRGLCFSKLQEFDSAAREYVKAQQLSAPAKDLSYELGKTYYANHQLKEALLAFQRSYKEGYELSSSLYYMGYIYQSKKQYDAALKLYSKVTEPESVKQAASFQIAEIYYNQAIEIADLEKRKEVLHDKVIPAYTQTFKMSRRSPLGKESKRVIKEIRSEYFSRELILQKDWNAKFTGVVKYYSNVVNQADSARIQISDTSSFILYNKGEGEYTFKKDDWSLIPKFKYDYAWHTRRDEPKVYQNDTLNFGPTLELKLKHELLKRKGQASFEYQYSQMRRDYQKIHSLDYYLSYHEVQLGEIWNYFKTGPSIMKLGYKFTRSQDTAFTSQGPNWMLGQIAVLTDQLTAMGAMTMDFQYAHKPINNLVTYNFITGLTMSDIIWDIDARGTLKYSVYDTRNQRKTRGIENSLDPAITFYRVMFTGFTLNTSYAFSKRFSRDKKNYNYQKHVVSIGVEYQI